MREVLPLVIALGHRFLLDLRILAPGVGAKPPRPKPEEDERGSHRDTDEARNPFAENHRSIEEHESEKPVRRDFDPPGSIAISAGVDPPPEGVRRPQEGESVVEKESGPEATPKSSSVWRAVSRAALEWLQSWT
jgi:hypothetical protein